MDEKELQALYNAMSKQFDVGDWNSFKSKMQTTDQRKNFYDAVGKNGYDLGGYNEYEGRIAGTVKKKESSPVSAMGSKIGGQAGTSVPQSVEQKTPQQKLSNLGVNVTFDKKQPLAPNTDATSPIYKRFDEPTYIDVENPESLSTLSTMVTEAKKKADPYKYAAFAEPSLGLKNKEFAKKSAEANELMSEVSQQAVKNTFKKVVSTTPIEKIDRNTMLEAGLEYVKQVDPLQYKRNLTILNKGEDLGDENKYNLEKIGGQILKGGIGSVTNDEGVLGNIEKLNQETDISHPEIATAKGWDIIGAYNHKKDNQANNGWNRTRPTVGQLKKWLNEPELLEMFAGNEVSLELIKKQISELPENTDNFKIDDVPVGGFVNNFGKAIGGGFESIGNIFRSDVKRQQSNLNPTIGRGSLTGNYRDPGESPALLQDLYNLESKEKDGTLTDDEIDKLAALRKSTKVRDGWDKFADGTGNITGQVVFQALGTKGIGLGTGGAAKILSLSKAAKTNVDASIAVALNSYDQARQQGLYNFPDDKLKQNIYTGTMVLANSVSERIFKDEKVLNALKKELQGDLVNSIKNLSAKNINRAAVKDLVTEKIVKFAGQTFKEANKESIEEAVVQAVDELSQSTLGAEGYDDQKALERIGNTYGTTLLYSGIVSGLAAKSNMAADNFNRINIYKMATNPGIFQNELQRQYESGEITDQERNQKLELLDKATEIAAAEPPKVAALSTKKRAEYLTQNLNIAINEQELLAAKDPNLIAELKSNIEESSKRAKEIYDSKPEVLEEITEPKEEPVELLDQERELDMGDKELTGEGAVIQKAIDENVLKGMDAEMAKAALTAEGGVEQFLSDISDQALDKKPVEGISAEENMKRARKTYGDEIVNLAIEKFPAETKIEEPTVSETEGAGSSGVEGKSDVVVDKASNVGGEIKEGNVIKNIEPYYNNTRKEKGDYEIEKIHDNGDVSGFYKSEGQEGSFYLSKKSLEDAINKRDQSLSKQESGGKAPVTKSEGEVEGETVKEKIQEDKDTLLVEGIRNVAKNKAASDLLKIAMQKEVIPENQYNQFGKELAAIKVTPKSKTAIVEVAELIQKYSDVKNEKTKDVIKEQNQAIENADFEKRAYADMTPQEKFEAVIEDKSHTSEKLTPEELKFVNENYFAPKGYRYNENFEIVKAKNETKQEPTKDTQSKQAEQEPQPEKTIVEDKQGAGKEIEGEDKIRLAHADTEQIYKEAELPERLETPTKKNADLEIEAEKAIKDGYNFNEVAKRVMEGDYNFEDVDQVAFAKRVGALKAKQRGLDIKSEEFEKLQNEIETLSRASDVAGTVSGRALQARKVFVPKEESLADYVMVEKEINNDAPLTDKQKETVQKEFNDIEKAKQDFEKYMAQKEAAFAKQQAEAEINKAKSTVKKDRKKDYATERKQIIEDIREKLKKARGDTSSTIIPYAKELIAISPDVAKLVKNLLADGVTRFGDIIDNVHENLKEYIPQITKDDVTDLVAGKYVEKKKTRNKLAEEAFDIKRQAQLTNKLEALLKGEEPVSEKRKIRRNQEIERLKKQIKDIEGFEAEKQKELDAKLKAAESEAKKLDKELSKEEKEKIVKSAEEKALDSRKKSLKKALNKVEEQLRTGDYSIPEKKKAVKLDKEGMALRDKLMQAQQKRDARIVLAQRMGETPTQTGMRYAAEVLNIPRTLMTIGDFSALLRQNLFFSVGHPLMTAKNVPDMFKSFTSQKVYDRWFADLKETPRYAVIENSRLAIADSLSHDLTKREEAFMSTLAEKIPLIGSTTKIAGVKIPGTNIVKGSERSYTLLLNKMRVDMFNYFADKLESRGITFDNSPKVYKATAEYINNATGRSDFGKTLNRIAPILNSVFFSPRLIASRVNMLTYWAQPRFWKTLPKEVRVDYFRNWLSLLTIGGTIIALAKLGGADTEDDPRSSDFGKIKAGDTRWDIWGGAQPYVRALAQIATGKRKSTKSGEIYDLDGKDIFGSSRADVATSFFRNKLAPVPGAMVDVLSGRTSNGDRIIYEWGGAEGKEISINDYVIQRLLPMTITGTQEAIKDQGLKAIFTVGIPSTFGIGTQTYSSENKKKTKTNHQK